MRFLFFDRVTDLELGRRIVGVRSFPLSDGFLRGHFDRRAVVPGTILIEAMAQLLGWLITASHGFRVVALVSRVDDVTIADPLLHPGAAVTITAEILSTSDADSLGRARIEANGAVLATAGRVIYSHAPIADAAALAARFRVLSGIDAAGSGRGGLA